jgi:hypothetical protein
MLGTELPVSIFTTKSPIDMLRFNVPQLKEFLACSVKDRYQLNYFICIKDFNAQALVSFKKYMPPPLPYFKVNIYPFPLPHFASISISLS